MSSGASPAYPFLKLLRYNAVSYGDVIHYGILFRRQIRIEESIDKALDDILEDFEIKSFLMANRVGMKKMLLTEYNETETMALFKEEGWEEGHRQAILKSIRSIMKTLNLTAAQAMNALQLSSEDQKKYAAQL